MRNRTMAAGLTLVVALLGVAAGAQPAAASEPKSTAGVIQPMAATGDVRGVRTTRNELGAVVATLPFDRHVGDQGHLDRPAVVRPHRAGRPARRVLIAHVAAGRGRISVPGRPRDVT